jgi:hypothetical protein
MSEPFPRLSEISLSLSGIPVGDQAHHRLTPEDSERTDRTEGRPYRSHKIPACDRCRTRKLRCTVEVRGQPCRTCQKSTAPCAYTTKGGRSKRRNRTTGKQSIGNSESSKQINSSQSTNDHSLSLFSNQQLSFSYPRNVLSSPMQSPGDDRLSSPSAAENPGSRSSLIVGPVVAEDVQLIQDFMSSQGRLQHQPPELLYDTISDNPRDPVLYLTVPRRRLGLSHKNRPGEKQREILEQILGPFINEVIAL